VEALVLLGCTRHTLQYTNVCRVDLLDAASAPLSVCSLRLNRLVLLELEDAEGPVRPHVLPLSLDDRVRKNGVGRRETVDSILDGQRSKPLHERLLAVGVDAGLALLRVQVISACVAEEGAVFEVVGEVTSQQEMGFGQRLLFLPFFLLSLAGGGCRCLLHVTCLNIPRFLRNLLLWVKHGVLAILCGLLDV
jgi:hypothetical protein